MAGHSRWAQVKRKKAVIDAKRGKVFTRLLREIQVAAKVGGAQLEGNPRLKTAVQAAKASSVPWENIQRAIKRGSGDIEGENYEEIIYEGFGPGGVAILIKALTENRNRTVAELRQILTRANGSLGTSNSVARFFQEKGVITIKKSAVSEEKLFELALACGAEDVGDAGEDWEVLTALQDFHLVRDSLEQLGVDLEAGVKHLPVSTILVAHKEAGALLELLDALDDLDDVQSVAANFEMDEREFQAAAK